MYLGFNQWGLERIKKPNESKADSPPLQKAKEKEGSSKPKKAISGEGTQVSKGSSPKQNPPKTTWIESSTLQGLSKACSWLHANMGDMPDDTPLEVKLGATDFNYHEEASTWVFQGWCERVPLRRYVECFVNYFQYLIIYLCYVLWFCFELKITPRVSLWTRSVWVVLSRFRPSWQLFANPSWG